MAHICLGGVVVVGWGWGGQGMVGWVGLELTDTLVGSCISQSKHANLIYYVYFCALVYILHYFMLISTFWVLFYSVVIIRGLL